MGLYETTFIVNPQSDDATIDRHVQAVVDIVSGAGGKVVYENRMGTRRLAYPIDGLTQGYYANFIFEAPKTVVPQLDRHMRLGEAYMRHLTVVFEGAVPDKDAPPPSHEGFHRHGRGGRSDRPFGRREGGRDRGKPEPAAESQDKKVSAESPAAAEETTPAVTPPTAPAEPEKPTAPAEPVTPEADERPAVPPAEPERTKPATAQEPPAPEPTEESEPAEEDTYREEEEL
jgi:small subunit ribosomal protein S6